MKRQMALMGFSLFLGLPTWANRVGNGGNILVCNKDGKESLQLLDLYESSLPPRNEKDSKDAFALAKAALESFRKYDRKISEQYLLALEKMKSEIEFKPDIEIQSSNDSKLKETPLGCRLVQIALRKNDVSSIEQKFIFSKTYWDRLALADQAGLLVHEIVYDHFYKLGEQDSLKARKLVAYLMSARIEQDSKDEVQSFVRSLKVPLYRSP
jgi:hypothetical protein